MAFSFLVERGYMKSNIKLEEKTSFKNLVLRAQTVFNTKIDLFEYLKSFSLWINNQINDIDSSTIPVDKSILKTHSKEINESMTLILLDINEAQKTDEISIKLGYLSSAKFHFYHMNKSYLMYLSCERFPVRLFKEIDLYIEEILKD